MINKPTPLPYPYYFWQVVGLASLGLLTSIYLAYTHYKNHTDIAFSSFCAVTQAINCDTVAQSPWSILWGLPIAAWGIAGYLFFLFLLLPLRRQNDSNIPCWSLLILLGLIFVGFSITLAIISHTRIHSWCLLCVGIYAVNFLLAFSSWIVFRRFSNSNLVASWPIAYTIIARGVRFKVGIILMILAYSIFRILLPPYWMQEPVAITSEIATGVTQEGYPWIGATKPQVIIDEFTDYQCFQCKKMHHYLRQLVARYPDRIRLVHRHFPLDQEFNSVIAPNPFHVGSGRLALIGIVATQHNTFWEVNDALYKAAQDKTEVIDLEKFSKLINIPQEDLAKAIFNEQSLKHLRHDIVEGLQLGIIGTPSFVVNKKMYSQTLPPELLRDILR